METEETEKQLNRGKTDFANGKIWRIVLAQSVPLMMAQLVHLLYNVVDRIYIGHLPGEGSLALTGVGLAFPITTLIAAFTALFGNGGAPLFSIARGAKEEKTAERVLSQSFLMLIITSVVLFTFCMAFCEPILYLFGAGPESIGYAESYLRIYLLGTIFSMLSTGLNPFINAQGFPRIGMGTIVVGAVMNLILDPIFIYGLGLGVRGAAIATVVSQACSCLWVLHFFFKGRTMYRIRWENLRPDPALIRKITALGLSPFIMQATNCLVQIVCNKMLNIYGGDLYVGIMTVINSIREILSLPASSIGSGTQSVLGYNFGAKKYTRVKQGIRFMSIVGIGYMLVAWLLVVIFPQFFMSLFTTDATMIAVGEPAMRLYFFGFFFMALQFSGQSTFMALGCTKRAITFSLFRKVVIVVPLTIFLAASMGMGVTGVFLAEPISNAIGGTASFVVMLLTLYRKLPEDGVTINV